MNILGDVSKSDGFLKAGGFFQSAGFQKKNWLFTLPKTNRSNSEFTPENRPFVPKGKFIFQPSIFRGELLVFREGNTRILHFAIENCFETTKILLENDMTDLESCCWAVQKTSTLKSPSGQEGDLLEEGQPVRGLRDEQWPVDPGGLGHIGDEILPSYILYEQLNNPWLFSVYRGLYYPAI